LSQVACLLQCGGIWLGGKGWGVTWKLVQAVVKPRELASLSGKCRVHLSMSDTAALDAQVVVDADEDTTVPETEPAPATNIQKTTVKLSVVVDDSDDEAESAPVVPAPAPVAEEEEEAPVEEKKPTLVKKVVKKVVAKK